jgi:hypothetical protein
LHGSSLAERPAAINGPSAPAAMSAANALLRERLRGERFGLPSEQHVSSRASELRLSSGAEAGAD